MVFSCDTLGERHKYKLSRMTFTTNDKIGSTALVLSGGGARGAFQVGCLKALVSVSNLKSTDIGAITGTSIGAVNSLIIGAGIKHSLSDVVERLEMVWKNRTYKTTFSGHISKTFLRSIQVAMLRYKSPGPVASKVSIFDPGPLIREVDSVMQYYGGLSTNTLPEHLNAVGVIATLEGQERKPLFIGICRNREVVDLEKCTFETLYLDSLTAAHGLASAALPSVLPAVDLNVDKKEIRLVDGGISDNHPVDPALRHGTTKAILLDASGRNWWFDHYGEAHDTREKWEVPSKDDTFCALPAQIFKAANNDPLGSLLKEAVGSSTKDFIAALGPTWPIFRILKHKMGEELAYEVLSYAALDKQYITALIDAGYKETCRILAQQNNKIF